MPRLNTKARDAARVIFDLMGKVATYDTRSLTFSKLDLGTGFDSYEMKAQVLNNTMQLCVEVAINAVLLDYYTEKFNKLNSAGMFAKIAANNSAQRESLAKKVEELKNIQAALLKNKIVLGENYQKLVDLIIEFLTQRHPGLFVNNSDVFENDKIASDERAIDFVVKHFESQSMQKNESDVFAALTDLLTGKGYYANLGLLDRVTANALAGKILDWIAFDQKVVAIKDNKEGHKKGSKTIGKSGIDQTANIPVDGFVFDLNVPILVAGSNGDAQQEYADLNVLTKLLESLVISNSIKIKPIENEGSVIAYDIHVRDDAGGVDYAVPFAQNEPVKYRDVLAVVLINAIARNESTTRKAIRLPENKAELQAIHDMLSAFKPMLVRGSDQGVELLLARVNTVLRNKDREDYAGLLQDIPDVSAPSPEWQELLDAAEQEEQVYRSLSRGAASSSESEYDESASEYDSEEEEPRRSVSPAPAASAKQPEHTRTTRARSGSKEELQQPEQKKRAARSRSGSESSVQSTASAKQPKPMLRGSLHGGTRPTAEELKNGAAALKKKR